MKSDKVDFWILVEEHQERVLNTCYRFVHRREDAEDLTQEVFLEVYRSLDKFHGDAKFSTWIYRIAVTKSIDFLRKQKRKKRFAEAKRVFGLKNEPLPELPANEKSRPDEILQEQERQEILRKAVNSLPENQKTAIILSKYEGFKQKEIAEIMDSTVPAVESLVHRGMNNLSSYLNKTYGKKITSFLLVFRGDDV